MRVADFISSCYRFFRLLESFISVSLSSFPTQTTMLSTPLLIINYCWPFYMLTFVFIRFLALFSCKCIFSGSHCVLKVYQIFSAINRVVDSLAVFVFSSREGIPTSYLMECLTVTKASICFVSVVSIEITCTSFLCPFRTLHCMVSACLSIIVRV